MRDILQVPNPKLNEVSKPVKIIDLSLIGDMRYHLDKPTCFGISAIQLGEPLRIIGVAMGLEKIFILNPEIVKHSEKKYPRVEGCFSLSYGKQEYQVYRYKQVKVKGRDLDWNEVTYKGRDIFGAVLQHEIDHLNGITIDRHGGLISF